MTPFVNLVVQLSGTGLQLPSNGRDLEGGAYLGEVLLLLQHMGVFARASHLVDDRRYRHFFGMGVAQLTDPATPDTHTNTRACAHTHSRTHPRCILVVPTL